jgi:tRNA(fMet)-specific endonuclease VapC
MKYFLDTNICIYYLKGLYPKLKEKLLSFNPEVISIPAIAKAELLFGAEKSKKRKENLEKIYEFLLPFQIQGFSNPETEIYASVRNNLEKKGIPIGPNDIIIASIVLSNDGTLVTHNTKEFNRIDGLLVEDWTK